MGSASSINFFERMGQSEIMHCLAHAQGTDRATTALLWYFCPLLRKICGQMLPVDRWVQFDSLLLILSWKEITFLYCKYLRNPNKQIMAPTIPKICGVKRSIFCTLVSTWGIIMLGIMGLLLSYKSLAFVEDLEAEDFGNSITNFYYEQDHKYASAATNCYSAMIMYAVTFLISLYHWVVYHKRGIVW